MLSNNDLRKKTDEVVNVDRAKLEHLLFIEKYYKEIIMLSTKTTLKLDTSKKINILNVVSESIDSLKHGNQ